MNDNVLSKVVIYLSTWPNEKIIEQNAKPYFNRRNDLSLQEGVVMFGLRVVVPSTYRGIILSELHKCHRGIVRIDALSRIQVWYPGIDNDIKTVPLNLVMNAQKSKISLRSHKNPWNWPTNPFDRVHVDFFLRGMKKMIYYDSYSKWLEIDCMTSTKSYDAIRVFHTLFSRFGFPVQLMSDNGPQFLSYEFDQFLKINDMKHIRSSAYHPCSKGGAERFVQTIKQDLKACSIALLDGKKLNYFLFGYRSTPSSVTGKPPSELFLGRQIRCRFDVMKPKNSNNLETSAKIKNG